MRILHIIFTHDIGGSERYAAELACAQAAAGHDVRLLIRPQGTRDMTIESFLSNDLVAVARVSPWGPAWHVRQHIKHFQPDVVHTHLGKAARLVGKLKPDCATVATLHLGYKAKNYGALDGLILLNETQETQCETGRYAGKTARISGWAPVFQRPTVTEVAAARAQVGADEETFVFGSVSRMTAGKGLAAVISAFQVIGDANTRLVLVGDGPERKALEKMAAPDSRIHFIGATPEVGLWHGAMDCFVTASESESFGLALLGAMQDGLPVITTATEGAGILLENQPGIQVPVGDVAALCMAMDQQIERGRRREAYVLGAFSIEGRLQEIDDFYEKLLRE